MESSNDGRTWTMTLRKGAKWSDGTEFTTEDVAFFVEDVAHYEPFGTAVTSGSRHIADAEFEVIDDYTFSFTYPQTNIAEVGRLAEHYVAWFHKGYLSQFHPEYAGQDKVDGMAKEAGFASAAEFFKDKIDEGQGFPRANPDLPTMTPWVLKVGAPATTYVFERNPVLPGGGRDRPAAPVLRRSAPACDHRPDRPQAAGVERRVRLHAVPGAGHLPGCQDHGGE